VIEGLDRGERRVIWPMRRAKHLRVAVPASAASLSLLAAGVFGLACTQATAGHKPLRSDSAQPCHFERTFDATHFQKGNLHTHTLQSDGDSDPRAVITWYRSSGYNFLSLTDHNVLTHPATFHDFEDPEFVLLPGEEVTMTGAGKQVHVNAICINQQVPAFAFPTQAEALVYAVQAIRVQNGVAIVNHPNFDAALSLADITGAGAQLLEIQSGHPYVFTNGQNGRPSHEALWDGALSQGDHLAGVGVDDVHQLARCADPAAYAGRAWIQTFNDRADRPAICESLRRGDLYTSTGPTLRRIRVDAHDYGVWPGFAGASVEFIGQNGRVISAVGPLTAEGSAHASAAIAAGADGAASGAAYLRAVVTAPDGTKAWTPAVFVVDDP
jgi:hypothetical protein